MDKTRIEKLRRVGCDFVSTTSDGKETVIFSAASEEIADAIDRMLGGVNDGGFLRGRRCGYKAGFKVGFKVGAAVIGIAGVIAGCIAIMAWIRKHSKKETEEADAE